MQRAKKSTIMLFLPEELKSAFEDKLKIEGLSKSLVIREMIKKYVGKNGLMGR